jgi:hypothetical protein
VKSTNAEMPATISGVTSGMSSRTPVAGAQRPVKRASPSAIDVPRIVATTVVAAAIWSEASSDSRRDSSSRNVSYQRREKPEKTCRERPELKEKRMTTRIGANSQT